MIKIKVLPPFQLENLLPFDFRYILTDKSIHQEHKDTLEAGKIHTLHTINPTNFIALRIQIVGTGIFKS